MLGPLPRTVQRNRCAAVKTDRYSKIIQAVSTVERSATVVAIIFMDHWIVPFGISSYILTDNSLQIVRKFLSSIRRYLGVKFLTAAAYHLQTNRQVERYNMTIGTLLRYYITENQRNYDISEPPLTYACNT